jgi:hypothetical protein
MRAPGSNNKEGKPMFENSVAGGRESPNILAATPFAAPPCRLSVLTPTEAHLTGLPDRPLALLRSVIESVKYGQASTSAHGTTRTICSSRLRPAMPRMARSDARSERSAINAAACPETLAATLAVRPTRAKTPPSSPRARRTVQASAVRVWVPAGTIVPRVSRG